MTAHKNLKRLVRDHMAKTGKSYQAALRDVRDDASMGPDAGSQKATSMKATTNPLLDPQSQLRHAIDALPPGQYLPGTPIEIEIPSLEYIDTKAEPGKPIPLVKPSYTTFRWGNVAHETRSVAAWIWDGLLWVEDWEVEAAGGIEQLPEWLRTRLGHGCVGVAIHCCQNNLASVTVLARSQTLERRVKLQITQHAHSLIEAMRLPKGTQDRLNSELKNATPHQFEDGTWEVVLPTLNQLDKGISLDWPDLNVRILGELSTGDLNAGMVIFIDPEPLGCASLE